MFEELMAEIEAKMAFETDQMLIIPPQPEIANIKFDILDYQNAKYSRIKRYISRDVKPISKNQIKKLLFE